MQIDPVRSCGSAISGAVVGPALDRIGGSGIEQSGADRPLRLKLGKRLLILVPAPINVAALMNGSRRPEKLVQALGQQRLFAAFFVGDLMTRWAWWRCPSR